MEMCGVVVSSVFAVVLVLKLGLTPIMAQREEQQTGVAGKEVILSCKIINHQKDVTCTWKYKYKEVSSTILRFSRAQVLKGKAPMIHRSELNLSSKQLKVSDLNLDDAGIYICECHPHAVSISLQVFKYSGTWTCHIHSDSPSINQNISFDVKVLGFGKEHMEAVYTTVGNTVILSWYLNFRGIAWKEGFTGKLNWEPQGNRIIHELLDFNVTTHRELHETKKSNHIWFEIPEKKARSTIEVKIPKVQLNHSGQYQCQLEINSRRMKSMRALVVMQVSADPAGPLSRGGKMSLLCQVSGPLPSNAHLLWERVNGTQLETKKSKQREAKVEVSVSAPGLWNCHLMEDNNIKISLNYTVEEAHVWNSYAVIGAIIGASVLLIGLVCLCIIMETSKKDGTSKTVLAGKEDMSVSTPDV
ncbi:UNVERIFIED_CONTAM: hypothetical protein H355_014684 [Colinus virginianus]|nr:hypothetical protein H355_014684 [Colinus virginianus]